MLGMIVYPDMWKQAPLFEVENPQLHQMLGFRGSHVSFNDFIRDGRYLLSEVVNEAYNKRVQARTDLDKEVMKLDEKINVFYMVQTGDFLKIFPDPEAEDGSWHAVSDLLEHNHAVNDTLGKVFLLYTRALREGDNELASEIVSFIASKQEQDTLHELHPGKKRAEILYNRINIFSAAGEDVWDLWYYAAVFAVYADFQTPEMGGVYVQGRRSSPCRVFPGAHHLFRGKVVHKWVCTLEQRV